MPCDAPYGKRRFVVKPTRRNVVVFDCVLSCTALVFVNQGQGGGKVNVTDTEGKLWVISSQGLMRQPPAGIGRLRSLSRQSKAKAVPPPAESPETMIWLGWMLASSMR